MFPLLNITEQSTHDYWIGNNSIQQHDHSPLQLPYANLWICQSGRAKISVNFKQYDYQQGDILFVSDDSIVVIHQCSSDFSVFYCLMARSFASEVAYVLPSDLFSYLRDYPHFVPQQDYANFIHNWIEQMSFLTRNSESLCSHNIV